MLRVLGRVRLSRDTDASTSVERQRQDIETWARNNGAEIVGWAEDVDVSGKLDPFKTPDLGPWLRPPMMNDWDVMVAWKWDRISRGGQRPKQKLLDWAEDHGKYIITIKDSIDTRNNDFVTGMMLTFIAESAKSERQAIVDRQTSSQKYLRKLGRYSGGPVPFGYRKVKRDDGWYIESDPDDSDTVRSLIDRYMAGESLRSLAIWLNNAGIKSPKGGNWATSSLSVMFRSRALIGQSTHKGAVVVGEDGMPVQRAEPLISVTRYHELQERLNGARKRPAGKLTGKPALLLDVILCGECGSKMYFHHSYKRPTQTRRGFDNRYWRCSAKSHPKPGRPECTARSIPAAYTEAAIIKYVTTVVGDEPVRVEKFFPAEGVGADLAVVEDAISGARKEKDEGMYDGDEESYFTRLRGLIARRNELRAMPNRPARTEMVETGGTWRQAIEAARDDEERRAVLLKLGTQFIARRIDNGDISVLPAPNMGTLTEHVPDAFLTPALVPFTINGATGEVTLPDGGVLVPA